MTSWRIVRGHLFRRVARALTTLKSSIKSDEKEKKPSKDKKQRIVWCFFLKKCSRKRTTRTNHLPGLSRYIKQFSFGHAEVC